MSFESMDEQSMDGIEQTRRDRRHGAKAPHPQTNGDHIRAMSDEELAELHDGINCRGCRARPICVGYHSSGQCKETTMRWLKQPAGEEQHGDE